MTAGSPEANTPGCPCEHDPEAGAQDLGSRGNAPHTVPTLVRMQVSRSMQPSGAGPGAGAPHRGGAALGPSKRTETVLHPELDHEETLMQRPAERPRCLPVSPRPRTC